MLYLQGKLVDIGGKTVDIRAVLRGDLILNPARLPISPLWPLYRKHLCNVLRIGAPLVRHNSVASQ